MNELIKNQSVLSNPMQRRVLVVDDAAIMVRTLAGMLNNLGYHDILRANNGIEALEALAQCDYQCDLIISDWNMPKMNGLSLLSEVRTLASSRHIPFIMVTANVEQEDVLAAINQGVSAYLIKPFSQEMLKARIKKALSSPVPKVITPIADTPAQSSPVSETEQDKPFSILIVDDEPNNITVISELLKGKFKLQAARSGKKAIEICQKETLPDLILLDIMMPEMDGLAVCRQLKSQSHTEHIPIIFVSALTQTDDVVKGLTIGAVDYVTKPIIPEIFLARIDIHINQLKQRNHLASEIDVLMDNVRVRDDIERMFQHDLKNPLMAIQATMNSLQAKSQQVDNEVSIIAQSVNVIEAMINNHGTLHQLEKNAYKVSKTNIAASPFLKTILYGLKQKCLDEAVAIRYRIPESVTFDGDKQLCYTLFSNLINNAIEAAPKNTEVVISASPTGANAIIFTIHNQGVIPNEIRHNFFDKYVTMGKEKGSGIGTYSAKLAVKAHLGEIDFSSSQSKGTTLTVTLPK